MLAASALVMLVGGGIVPGWMVAAIVVRELLVSVCGSLRPSGASSSTRVTSAS